MNKVNIMITNEYDEWLCINNLDNKCKIKKLKLGLINMNYL